MPIPRAREVKLSEAERDSLAKLIKRHQVGQQIALRAKIVLAAGDGQKNKEIAMTIPSPITGLKPAGKPGE